MVRGIGNEVVNSAALNSGRQTASAEKAGPSFSKQFGEQLREVSELVEKAESSAASMAAGEAGSVETILSLSRAELALRHVVSVRNRLLESYREVMNLPL